MLDQSADLNASEDPLPYPTILYLSASCPAWILRPIFGFAFKRLAPVYGSQFWSFRIPSLAEPLLSANFSLIIPAPFLLIFILSYAAALFSDNRFTFKFLYLPLVIPSNLLFAPCSLFRTIQALSISSRAFSCWFPVFQLFYNRAFSYFIMMILIHFL